MRVGDRYSQYLKHLRKEGKAEKTIQSYASYLRGALSHSVQEKKIRHFKLADIADIQMAGRQHKEWGEQRTVSVFRCYWRYLQKSGVKLPFHWRDIKVPPGPDKEQPVFEPEELETAFGLIPINSSYPCARKMAWTTRAVLEVQLGTGMRIHEVLMLERVQFEEIKTKKEIIICGKGKKRATVVFSDRAIEWLERYLNQRNDLSKSMFVNALGDPLGMPTFRSYMERLKKRFHERGHELIANKFRTHTIRRTVATYLLEHGADIKSVQTILRHKSERTTIRHYIRVNIKRAKLVHHILMAQFGEAEAKRRYRVVNGQVMVRLTKNGGRWTVLPTTYPQN